MQPPSYPRSAFRLLRSALAAVILLVVATPSALGGSTNVVLGRWGAELAHVCKCGMAPGKCGCRECERLEHERRHGHGPVPALTTDCGDETFALSNAGLPLGVVAAAPAIVQAAPPARASARPRANTMLSRTGEGPPPRPPRSA